LLIFFRRRIVSIIDSEGEEKEAPTYKGRRGGWSLPAPRR
jgi:hypothetical protein